MMRVTTKTDSAQPADGAPGLKKALAALWDGAPVQRCTVHNHRNLLAHAPERYAATPQEIATRRKAFIRKWRLRLADVHEETRRSSNDLSP